MLALGATASRSEAGSPAAAAQPYCRYADSLAVDPTSRRYADGALWCLINRERTSRGLRALARSSRLEKAARRHARDMRRRGYFSHRSPAGRDAVDRVDRYTSYLEDTRSWQVGETLGKCGAHTATARSVVRAMLASPSHREVLLTARYRHIGVGWTIGTPDGDDRGATVAVLLGDR